VGKLERDLGVKLFDRSGRRAVLTPAGEELLQEGRQLLALAGEIECRVQEVAKGWEVELRIAVDNILPAEALLDLVAAFDREQTGTRMRLAYEVLGGTWDALVENRADLAVGAGGEPPAQAGFSVRRLAQVKFLFCVAPNHPLASAKEPLTPRVLAAHRAVAVGDTSPRNAARRSVGLLLGQDTLVVPDFAAKVEAQRRGLGVGYLPEPLARSEAAARRLRVKQVSEPYEATLYVAWRTANKGRALTWFLDRLASGGVAAAAGGQRVTRLAMQPEQAS